MTVNLFVQLTVKDFDTWKQHFDGAAPFMENMGVVSTTIHRHLDDPNSIMIAQQISENSLKEYLAILDGSKERQAEEGILTWTQWVGRVA